MKKLFTILFLFGWLASVSQVTSVSTNIKLAAGNSPGQLLRLTNGVFSNSDDIAPFAQAAANLWLQFNFNSPVIVSQIIWNQAYARYSGDFKVQGSKDGSNWVDLSGNFQLGSVTPQKLSFSNSVAYSYYRLLGVAGNIASVYWWEVQFNTSLPTPPPVTDTSLNNLIRKIANEEIRKLDSLTFKSGNGYDTVSINQNKRYLILRLQ